MVSRSSTVKRSFTELPYSDRQLVIVVQDEAAKAVRDAEKKVFAKWQRVDWVRVCQIALLALFPFGGLVSEITKETIRAWKRAKTNDIQILLIGKSEAGEISFPPGHPRERVLYIGHPGIPKVYYTTAEFHRITFEHKFSEAINLLMSLGATKIRVEHIIGWGKDFSSRLSVPIGDAPGSLNAEIGTNSTSKSQLLYEATLPGSQAPCIPECLVWYPHESTWQSIAQGRIKFGLRDFSLTVAYEDDFGVNAGLKASILKWGLELGGKFEDHVSTVWRIQGEFKPETQMI